MDIARAVNTLLEDSGMTQADVARKGGFSTAWVNMVCKGKTKDITLEKAKTLCDVFGVTLDEFAKLSSTQPDAPE